MNLILVGTGVWLLSDAIYSYTLYAHSQSWRGERQSWAKDHWIRGVRAMCAVIIVIIGAIG